MFSSLPPFCFDLYFFITRVMGDAQEQSDFFPPEAARLSDFDDSTKRLPYL
jgi:hypothetical protein